MAVVAVLAMAVTMSASMAVLAAVVVILPAVQVELDHKVAMVELVREQQLAAVVVLVQSVLTLLAIMVEQVEQVLILSLAGRLQHLQV
jgi:hypothetical protein